jgi:hypothetical protein
VIRTPGAVTRALARQTSAIDVAHVGRE